jgi:hypothetical protein
LPLAGPALYHALGPNWAGTLLGLLEVLIVPIPFLFYRYGAKIRARSGMIREMREIENHNRRKRERAERKLLAAQASGNPEAEKFARSELTRVKSRQTYGVPDDDRHVGRVANAELTRAEGLTQKDLEAQVGIRMARD